MERLLVTGGARLAGSVRVSGAKNSALKLMAAALLAPGRTVLRNVPAHPGLPHDGRGARAPGRRRGLGRRTRSRSTPRRSRRSRPPTNWCAACAPPPPCSARCSRAPVRLGSRCPGGDEIGSRPIDLHIAGLRAMGAEIGSEHGFLVAETAGLRGRGDHPRLPQRRRHREPDDGGGPRARHDRDRQRRA